jgi:hypothetical protein
VTTPLQKELADLSYRDVEPLVVKTVHDFLRADRVYANQPPAAQAQRFEEFLEAAWEAYCEAYATQDDARGAKFSTWVAYKVWRACQTHRRKEAQDKVALKQVAVPEVEAKERFSAPAFLSELSDDAALVAAVVLDSALDLRLALVGAHRLPDSKRPEVVRGALRAWLHDLGWPLSRVSRTFTEIREALS